MIKGNNAEDFAGKIHKRKPQRKITPQRLKNIGLYYLQRFETSVENLRTVLRRKVQAYARENPEFDKSAAYQWVEDVLAEFEHLHYLDDGRFAEIKIRGYLAAGKPARYIFNKLREKGIAEAEIKRLLEDQEYDPLQMAQQFVRHKKIGPYRAADKRREYWQKDLAALVRAGFDYDVAVKVINLSIPDESGEFFDNYADC